jgi:hypothetical protein
MMTTPTMAIMESKSDRLKGGKTDIAIKDGPGVAVKSESETAIEQEPFERKSYLFVHRREPRAFVFREI